MDSHQIHISRAHTERNFTTVKHKHQINHNIKICKQMSFTSSRFHRRTGLLLMMITVNQETEVGKYDTKNADVILFLILNLQRLCNKTFNSQSNLSEHVLLQISQMSNAYNFLCI